MPDPTVKGQSMTRAKKLAFYLLAALLAGLFAVLLLAAPVSFSVLLPL